MSRACALGRTALTCGFVVLGLIPASPGQEPKPSGSVSSSVPPPQIAVLQALRANPITAPYPIATAWRAGRVVLSGSVGTKRVHDTAVRLAIAVGYPVSDELKIDTAEAHRVAARAALGAPAPGASAGLLPGSNPYYIYPQPLFGRLDEPFYGFEPPLLSYAPWWPYTAAREPVSIPPARTAQAPPVGSAAAGGPAQGAVGATGSPVAVPLGNSGKDGVVEMTINPRGVAVLRGTVASLAVRVAVGQRIAQTPGVAEVINELQVGPTASAEPPPPPQPAFPAAEKPPAAAQPAPPPDDKQPRPALAPDRGDLTARVEKNLDGRPALAGLAIKVSTRDGVVLLSGRVPSVYEAMLAFRAAQQTPGVHEVDDRLEFVVPDGVHKNVLLEKGRPEDVEPYLLAQIRRQVGDVAHVDQVRLRGENLEVRGTLLDAGDQARLEAILRSMPVLRDFQLEPVFTLD